MKPAKENGLFERGKPRMKEIMEQAKQLARELIEQARLKSKDIVIIGCSTSEVAGKRIGSNSDEETAVVLFQAFQEVFESCNIFMAVQCCEHLNRAIVTEREAAKDMEEVSVIPQIKAGGAMAYTAFRRMKNPVVIEEIRADAGIDIGGTLIGMHLKKVAVPLRLSVKKIGEATVLTARTRAKLIGGSRAVYAPDL